MWFASAIDKQQVLEALDANVTSTFGGDFQRIDDTTWVRKAAGWKTDMIEVVPKTLMIVVSVSVVIPPPPGTDFDSTSIAFTNLPLLSGNPSGVYKYSEGKRLLARLDADFELVEPWFERLSTPEKCLDFMRADKGRNPEAPNSIYCREYLEEVLRSQR
jgi:hypothetical protein